MLSPAPPGVGPETHNKHSPRERSYYHPPVCRTTVPQGTALSATSPKVYPKVTAYRNLCFINKFFKGGGARKIFTS